MSIYFGIQAIKQPFYQKNKTTPTTNSTYENGESHQFANGNHCQIQTPHNLTRQLVSDKEYSKFDEYIGESSYIAQWVLYPQSCNFLIELLFLHKEI